MASREIPEYFHNSSASIQDLSQLLASFTDIEGGINNIKAHLNEDYIKEVNSSNKGAQVRLGVLRQGQSCTNTEDLAGGAIDIGTVTFLGFVKDQDASGKSGWHGKFSYDEQGQVPFQVPVGLIKISK